MGQKVTRDGVWPVLYLTHARIRQPNTTYVSGVRGLIKLFLNKRVAIPRQKNELDNRGKDAPL